MKIIKNCHVWLKLHCYITRNNTSIPQAAQALYKDADEGWQSGHAMHPDPCHIPYPWTNVRHQNTQT